MRRFSFDRPQCMKGAAGSILRFSSCRFWQTNGGKRVVKDSFYSIATIRLPRFERWFSSHLCLFRLWLFRLLDFPPPIG